MPLFLLFMVQCIPIVSRTIEKATSKRWRWHVANVACYIADPIDRSR